MKISARNQIKGKVIAVVEGATTAHVTVDIGGGNVVTAAITNESAKELGLATGGEVTVIVKSSDVMIGVG